MKSKSLSFILMHSGFLLYALYPVLGKIASRHDFLSIDFCIIYFIIFLLLFLYAIIWQQVLKSFRLPVAICNKASTIIWGMILSRIIFSEEITARKICGAIIIFCGILLLSIADRKQAEGEVK